MKARLFALVAVFALLGGCTREPAPTDAAPADEHAGHSHATDDHAGHNHAPGEGHGAPSAGSTAQSTSGEGEIVPMQGGKAGNGVAMSAADLAKEADVPLYPGAKTPDSTSKVTRTPEATRYEIAMVTEDSPENVIEFYKSKLDRADASADQVMGVSKSGNYVIVKALQDGERTKVTATVVSDKRLK